MKRNARMQIEMAPPAREIAVIDEADLRPLIGADANVEPAGASPEAASRPLLFLTLVAGIGGFLFGYDTGVISGALPYIRDDLLREYAGDAARLAWVQEAIVSAAIIAAGVGSAAGGAFSDAFGRKRALLLADVLFTVGAVAMGAAWDAGVLVAGRALVGLGVGLASVTVPVYIAECAPPAVRAGLVTTNVFMITGGQFLAYAVDYMCTFLPGTWRWMLGIAALPSLAQALMLLPLPESPKWLASRGRIPEAHKAMARLQQQPTRVLGAAAGGVGALGGETAAVPEEGGGGSWAEAAGWGGARGRQEAGRQRRGSGEGEKEEAREGEGEGEEAPLRQRESLSPSHSVHSVPQHGRGAQQAQRGGGAVWRLLRSGPVLRQLHIGVGLQVLQQLCGINTVMYYTPAILQLAGFHDKRTALLLALLPAGVNAAGTLVGMACIDRFGRRRLLLSSIAAVLLALSALGGAFYAAEQHSPLVDAAGSTCQAAAPPDCTACLRHGCGFCGVAEGETLAPGVCLALGNATEEQCSADPGHMLYLHGCPSRYTGYILAGLMAYLAAFSPGLGPVPWAVNAEIYPLQVRGLATGLAATSNWVTNAIVAQTFLTLTQLLGGSGAFWLYAAISGCGLLWTWWFLPETNGLSLDQIQLLFEQQAWSGKRRQSDALEGGVSLS